VIRFESPPEPPRRRDARPGRWSAWNFAGIAAVLLGVGLALIGVNRALTPEPPPQEAVRPPIRTVAANVPEDATVTAASGQQRMVRTSRGALLVLFVTPDGLRIATDGVNQGRIWRTPLTLPAISADTLSVDIDERDRMHLALAGEDGVFYAALQETRAGWSAPTLFELDDSPTEVVDVAYDPARELAHVVWSAEDPAGRAPRWIGIDVSEEPVLLAEEDLAAGGEGAAEVNVAAGTDGTVVATFRGEVPEGWTARALPAEPEVTEWGPQEGLDVQEIVSEASLTVDSRGVAHLVVAGEDGDLNYLRRNRRGIWIAGQPDITPAVTDPIDRPSVTADTASRLIYVFFRTGGDEEAVRVAIRDPASGWEGPYRIGIGQDIAAGVVAPTAPRTTAGHPMVIWTTRADPPSIEAARIIAP
jgi:hypothetical protein